MMITRQMTNNRLFVSTHSENQCWSGIHSVTGCGSRKKTDPDLNPPCVESKEELHVFDTVKQQ